MWQDKISHLTNWLVGERKIGGKIEKRMREKRGRRRRKREKLHILSSFGNRQLLSEREAKFAQATRDSHRDQNLGISPSSEK